MLDLKDIVKNLQEINQKYELSNENLNRLEEEMSVAKVCTPVIGKFSSGKSSLINTLLGYKKSLLKEDITPETAVPAQLCYAPENRITVYKNDGSFYELPTFEYRKFEADANSVKCTKLELNNEFLKKIPDVMLVDMPGFESGFEIHNKAIDNYLPQSLAYIITFPADDMILRTSIVNILKELSLNNMPICVVITKYDKRNDEFEESLKYLQDSIKRYVKNSEVSFYKAEKRPSGADEVVEFLQKIQEQSKQLLENKNLSANYL